MSALLDDIEQHLVDAGVVGGSSGWTCFKGFLPNAPDKTIGLFETMGEEPEVIAEGSSEPAYVKPSFQVRGRGEAFGYEALRLKMKEVFDNLHESEPTPVTTGASQYIYCYAISSGPLPMGQDVNQRPQLSWNFRTMRER